MRTLLLGVLYTYSLLLATALSGNTNPQHFAALKISGKIINSQSNQALEYATISAYNTDSVLVEGTVSNDQGEFMLQLEKGLYYLKIDFIGFVQQSIQLQVSKSVQLETIQLVPNELILDAVEVTAEKSQTSLMLDKKVFNVGKDLTAQGGSANDILDNVPSVTVEANGAVSLRGNSGVRILINGRPSALADNNALQSIPAESIDRVEVITNPSARYEASGNAGIINIVLKKDQNVGLGGTVNVASGIPADHRVNTSFNYRKNKLNAFFNGGLRYSDFKGSSVVERENRVDGVTSFFDRKSRQDRNDEAINAFTGFDYSFSDRSKLTASYSIYHMVNTDQTFSDFLFTNQKNELTRQWAQQLDYREPQTFQQLDLIYDYQFKDKKTKFTAYLKNDIWQDDEREQIAIDESFPVQADLLNLRTRSLENSRDHLLQFDVERKIGKNTNLEFGVRGETRIISSDYIAESIQGSEWEIYNDIKNQLNYYERIGSAYIQFNKKWKKIKFQGGLRNEYTFVKVAFEEQTPDIIKKYNQLFPSASLQYSLSEQSTLQVNYSKRIRRPYFGSLNPFGGLNDITNVFQGNADLDPAYTQRFELNWLRNWEKLTINPAVYFSTTTDYFEYIMQRRADDVLVTTLTNLERENQYGWELNLNYQPAKFLRISNDFNIYGFSQNGEFEGQDFDFESWTWTNRLQVQSDLPFDIRIQGSLSYQAPERNSQLEELEVIYADFGLSKKWTKRLTMTINVRNAFASRKWRATINRPSFTQYQEEVWQGRRISFGLSYRFDKGAGSEGRRQRGSIR